MEQDLIVLQNNEPRAGTLIMSQGFQVEHRALKRLIKKYYSEFETFGVITTALPKLGKKKEGRPSEEFLLNEEQALYLGTLLTNNEPVRKFKRALVKEFGRMKRTIQKILSQKQNAEWLEKREAGKISRREETDTIKKFVEYAKGQGSQSAEKYYMNISKMQNQALFFLEQKYPNLRDVLSLNQLSTIECADRITSRAIVEGMERLLPYKEIYQLAKARVEGFAEIHGKTLIPAFNQKTLPEHKE